MGLTDAASGQQIDCVDAIIQPAIQGWSVIEQHLYVGNEYFGPCFVRWANLPLNAEGGGVVYVVNRLQGGAMKGLGAYTKRSRHQKHRAGMNSG